MTNSGYTQPRRRTQSSRLNSSEPVAQAPQEKKTASTAYPPSHQGTLGGSSSAYAQQSNYVSYSSQSAQQPAQNQAVQKQSQQSAQAMPVQHYQQPVQRVAQAQPAQQPSHQSSQPVRSSTPSYYQPQAQAGYQNAQSAGQAAPRQHYQQQGYAQQPSNNAYAAQGQGGFNHQPVYQQVQQPNYGTNQRGNQSNFQMTSGYVPPKRPNTPGHMGGGNEPPKGNRNWIVILVAAVLVIGLAVGGYYYHQDAQVRAAVTAYDNVFCQGVYVDGINLGGMTAEEGVNAVTAQAQNRNDSWYVNLTYQGQVVTTLTASQLGMTVDVADIMNEAWAQGHTGDVYERQEAMEQLMVTPYEGYTATPGGDTSVVDSVLNEIKNLVYRAPTDAYLLSFDPSLTYPFTFQDEVEGRTLDIEPLKTKLYQMVSSMESGDVEIEPDTIAATVTTEDLKKQYTLRASVYTPISSKSSENRTNNIRRCFELISGYVLDAGSKFSFNSVVGKRTLANGFYEAIEYAYGTEVMGVGGGTCQASTTLYQAAVVAGLEIVDREPHSKAVSYANYGEDATVYWEGNRKIDLVFKNNTDSKIYIVASVQSDPSNRKRLIAKVSIYGESLGDDVRYELQSTTVEVLSAPTEPEYVKDTKQTYVTYTDEEYVARKAADGYKVESYRVKYVGDTVVEKTLLFTDTYKAQSELIYVGTKKRTE